MQPHSSGLKLQGDWVRIPPQHYWHPSPWISGPPPSLTCVEQALNQGMLGAPQEVAGSHFSSVMKTWGSRTAPGPGMQRHGVGRRSQWWLVPSARAGLGGTRGARQSIQPREPDMPTTSWAPRPASKWLYSEPMSFGHIFLQSGHRVGFVPGRAGRDGKASGGGSTSIRGSWVRPSFQVERKADRLQEGATAWMKTGSLERRRKCWVSWKCCTEPGCCWPSRHSGDHWGMLIPRAKGRGIFRNKRQ